ncbi:unnamed protein product [Staurois parvus]|uniref:Uncharacterized protein n=1 Tax=Staurois parvus TaxID=386267 RepID=A0ABN9AEU1_9NEOB|nr:unnamed protein product [Staurois parvus]
MLLKSPVEEKMEVEISPVTSNKRFAPSTAPNKTEKSVVAKHTMKLKDGVVPHSRAVESSIPKPANLQTQGDIKFSLKEMYFDDLPQHTKEEKSPLALLRDKKTKGDMQASSVTHAKLTTEGQIKETPKVAPRRSKEQRELSVGRKTSPITSKKSEAPVHGQVSNLSQTLLEVRPKSEPTKLAVVERNTNSSVSVPVGLITEQKVKAVKSTEKVLSVKVPDKVSSYVTSAPQKEQPLEDNKIPSVDPKEEKARTETLEKLQNLEVEYMALQKAYALLQQQLELSQKAEKMKAEEQRAEAQKAEAQRARAQKAEVQRAETIKEEAQKAEAIKEEARKAEALRARSLKAQVQRAETMEVEAIQSRNKEGGDTEGRGNESRGREDKGSKGRGTEGRDNQGRGTEGRGN